MDDSHILDWIEAQKSSMARLTQEWADINSHSLNLSGLKKISQKIQAAFKIFNEKIELWDLPPAEKVNSAGRIEKVPLGKAIYLRKRPRAKRQVLLICHMDTVYGEDHLPRKAFLKNKNTLVGPGAADPKGGMVVLLKALEAFEKSSVKNQLGWQIFINPDEEIGSPGSCKFLKKLASQSSMALVYEPCLANGHLIGERKGSGNFTLVVRGRSAHAGRDFHLGRSAVYALARCIVEIHSLNRRGGLTINAGQVEGGKAVNVIPDLALARFNIRVKKTDQQKSVLKMIDQVLKRIAEKEGVTIKRYGKFSAPPKPLDPKSLHLFKAIKKCARELGFDLNWEPSGGVCDGNRLAALGLPTIDTLGAQGGHLHSGREYLLVKSLTQRASLSYLFLQKFAQGKI